MARQLPVCGRADADALGEVALQPGGDPDERRDGDVGAPVAEERLLERVVGAVEGLVVPVEPAAGLRDADQEVEQDGAEHRVVLGRVSTGVGTCVDRGGGLGESSSSAMTASSRPRSRPARSSMK